MVPLSYVEPSSPSLLTETPGLRLTQSVFVVDGTRPRLEDEVAFEGHLQEARVCAGLVDEEAVVDRFVPAAGSWLWDAPPAFSEEKDDVPDFALPGCGAFRCEYFAG